MERAPSRLRVLKFGVFEVDLNAGELRKAGMRQKLAGQPFQVLQLLLEHPQEIVTREELQHRIWPKDTFVDYDLALKKAVNRVREALGDSVNSPRFIETIPRRGYRFIAPLAGNGVASSVVESPTEAVATDTRRSRRALRISIALGLGIAVLLLALFGMADIGQDRPPPDSVLGCSATAESFCGPHSGVFLRRDDRCADNGSSPD